MLKTFIKKKYISKLSEEQKFKILIILLKILRLFSYKRGYICVDNLYEKHASCIDAYTIFEYLKQHKKKSYYIIWKENLTFEKISKQNLIILEKAGAPNSSNYQFLRKSFRALINCKYFISSFYGSLPSKFRNFLLCEKSIRLVGIGHGPVFFKTLVFDFPFCQDKEWDYYLVSSEYEKEIFLSHGWSKNKLIVNSLPRFDLCREKTEKSHRKIFMMLTWRLTFEDDKNYIFSSKYLYNLFHFLNNKTLNNLLSENNIELVLGLHHALQDICCVNIDFPVKIANTNNLISEINSSDLFITDYSSIFFDSAYLNHPCIFWRIDSDDKFLNDIDKRDWKNVLEKDCDVYNVVYDENELILKIATYIKNNFKLEDEYSEKMNKFFSTRKNNTEQFIKILETKK